MTRNDVYNSTIPPIEVEYANRRLYPFENYDVPYKTFVHILLVTLNGLNGLLHTQYKLLLSLFLIALLF